MPEDQDIPTPSETEQVIAQAIGAFQPLMQLLSNKSSAAVPAPSAAALEWADKKTDEARRIVTHKLDGDRSGRVLFERPDGSIEAVEPKPHYRTITTSRLMDICDQAMAPFDNRTETVVRPVITYGFGYASLIFNSDSPYERIEYSAPETDEHVWIDHLHGAGPTGMDIGVRDAVTLFDLQMMYTAKADFVSKLGKLEVESGAEAREAHDAVSSMVGGIQNVRVRDSESLPTGTHTLNILPYCDPAPSLAKRLPVKLHLRANMDACSWVFIRDQASYMEYKVMAAELIGDLLRARIVQSADSYAIPIVRGEVFPRQGAPAQ